MNRKALIFAVAVAFQILILLAMPARQVYTRATGRAVILKVQPVDPYNSLNGYYVTLGYDISRREAFPNAPDLNRGDQVYAVIEEQSDGSWKPVALGTEVPRNLPSNRLFISGRMERSQIKYGIEELYIPEKQRGVIEEDLRKNINQARIEVKVDSYGNSALIRLIIEDRIY